MDRIFLRTCAIGLCLVMLAGCGGDGAGSGTAARNAPGRAAGAADQDAPPSDPAAIKAHEFFTAIMEGDVQRANSCLTPRAIQSLTERNELVSAAEFDQFVEFEIGRVVRPKTGLAFVECMARRKPSAEAEAAGDSSETEGPETEEIAILLEQVNDAWWVSGFAHRPDPSQPMKLFSYEAGQYLPVQRMANQNAGASQPAAAPAASRPSPPRTAEEAARPSYR